MMRWLFFFACLLAASNLHAQVTPETMCSLASSLTKVAKAVDGYVSQNPSAAAAMQGRALVEAATKPDPGLLDPFEGYSISARAQGRNSSVLVCTSDQALGLLEDAGCTARADAHRWQHNPPLLCGFSLDLDVTCSGVRPPAAANPCR